MTTASSLYFSVFTLTIWVLILTVWVLNWVRKIGRRPAGYPPGPPTIPLLGNLHQMPGKDAHLQFQKWAQQYGPIYTIMLGTRTMIVLSSDQTVKELVDKRGSTFNSRPDLYIAQEVSSGGLRLAFTPYGPLWRTQLRLAHETLNPKKVLTYLPYIDVENKQMLFDMMNEPSDILLHCRRFAGSLISSVVYGFRWPNFNDEGLQGVFSSIDEFVKVNSTASSAIADVFPIFRRLPSIIYRIKRKAKAHHIKERALYLSFLSRSKALIKTTTRPCTVRDVISFQKTDPSFTDPLAAYFAATLFEAGSDTTSTQIYSFIFALLLHPSVQKTAQAEIDAVIPATRLPTFADKSSLPYVSACVKEILRWYPSTIMGALPHCTTEASTYEGYTIPADATVIVNTWALNRDPNRYDNPDIFDPSRFLGDTTNSAESAALSDVSQRDHFTFGAGRRICVGMHLADESLFLAFARILWGFDVRLKEGKEMPERDRFTEGMVALPERFEDVLEFGVRGGKDSERGKVLVREWEGVKGRLDGEGQW